MNIYKYTNSLSDLDILECIIIAENENEALELANEVLERHNWGNAENGNIKPIKMKKGVLLESVDYN